MRYLTLLLRSLLWTAIAIAGEHAVLPDPTLTPGAADPRVTQETIRRTICKPGYTATVRHVPLSLKKQVMRRYGLPEADLAKVEIDHLVSLENGGANDVENLWPQYYEPFPGARDKDRLETALKRDVCAGRMTLEEDQRILRTDWYAEFKKRFGEARASK